MAWLPLHRKNRALPDDTIKQTRSLLPRNKNRATGIRIECYGCWRTSICLLTCTLAALGTAYSVVLFLLSATHRPSDPTRSRQGSQIGVTADQAETSTTVAAVYQKKQSCSTVGWGEVRTPATYNNLEMLGFAGSPQPTALKNARAIAEFSLKHAAQTGSNLQHSFDPASALALALLHK